MLTSCSSCSFELIASAVLTFTKLEDFTSCKKTDKKVQLKIGLKFPSCKIHAQAYQVKTNLILYWKALPSHLFLQNLCPFISAVTVTQLDCDQHTFPVKSKSSFLEMFLRSELSSMQIFPSFSDVAGLVLSLGFFPCGEFFFCSRVLPCSSSLLLLLLLTVSFCSETKQSNHKTKTN